MAQGGSGADWRRPAWPSFLLSLTAVLAVSLPQARAESFSFTGPTSVPQPLQLKKPPQPPARPTGSANAFLPKPPRNPLLSGAPVPVSLSAALTDQAPPLSRGITWYIHSADPDAEGRYALIERSDQAQPTLKLKPGDYVITTSYGRVVAAQRVTITDAASHRFVLNAGGLRLSAVVGAEKSIPDGLVSFSIHKPEPERAGDGKLLVADVKAGQIVRLAEGSYYVVSRYGGANAAVRANVRVEAGRLTDATMYHKAAAITLKLVNEPGGEALANTSWSILSPNGESVQESVGAFPTHILAAGQYTVIARHEGHVYNRDFSVQPGYDREVEVLARP
ncbi:MAG: hypothetical protein M3145_10350 [Pseudomonadota bacterium]|nr:hypothetical protein [Pseudomonadota bacterium]